MKTAAFLVLICTALLPALRAQVVISNSATASPHASAMLDVQSTARGMLVPRMTSAQRTAIAAPATGLLVFDNTSGTFWYRNAAGWVELVAGSPQNNLHDADNDTKIQVEESPDEDIVRVDLAGSERLLLRQNPGGSTLLELPNNSENVFIGPNAGLANTTGLQNTVIGAHALLANTTGNGNIAIGIFANSHNLDGFGNTAVGGSTMGTALTGIVPESGNSAFGAGAGFSHDAVYNNCTFLGGSSQASFTGVNRSNSTAVGNAASITASNQVRVGNAAVSSIGGQVGWTTFSDGRFKTDVSQDVKGLDFILRLRPVTYHLDAPQIAAALGEKTSPEATPMPGTELAQKSEIRYAGFIAQEVETAAAALGFDFSGVDRPKNEQDFYGLRYAEFTVPLVKAAQEQQAQINAQQAEIAGLTAHIIRLEAILDKLATAKEK